MLDSERSIGGASAWCRGATGELMVLQQPTILIYPGPRREIDCELLQNDATCKKGNLPCIFFASPELKRQDEIVCMTRVGELKLNHNTREVTSPLLDPGENLVSLREAEYSILYALMQNQGRVLTRRDLYGTYSSREWSSQNRAVDVQMTHLRKKLGQTDQHEVKLIETVIHKGYKIPRRKR